MSDRAGTRRDLLARAALAAGGLSAARLLAPAPAAAQSSDDDDLRDFLAPAIALEQISVLAYSNATRAKGVERLLRRTFETFGDQDQEHATALRQALDSLGFDVPDAPSSPSDAGVFDIDGIDDAQRSEFAGLLRRTGEIDNRAAALGLLIELERRQLDYYLSEAPSLDSEDLSTTGAEIAGCQAQHTVVLREARGDPPAAALAGVGSLAQGS
jgi:rubrerythrin